MTVLIKKYQWLCAIVAVLGSCILFTLPLFLGDVGEIKNQWFVFLGNFHPLILHLPIGALALIVLLEVFQRKLSKQQKHLIIPLVFHALTAVSAAIFGIFWYYSGSYSSASELLDDHLWQGIYYAVFSMWLPLIYALTTEKKHFIFQVLLVLTSLSLFSAAHHGGESVHGSPLDRAPWKQTNTDSQNSHTTSDTTDSPASGNQIIYTEIIIPILEEKCYSCHHSKHKVKSGLKLDTYADILKGGDSQDFDPHLTPGDPTKSSLITSIKLPDDDDLHMPPAKKEQITSQELALLTWWVSIGAPEKSKISDFELPQNIADLIPKK